MFRNNVFTFKNLPVEDKLRKRTDCICTICSSIFALTLFILSFVFFRKCNNKIIQKITWRLIFLRMTREKLVGTLTKNKYIHILLIRMIWALEGIVYHHVLMLANRLFVTSKLKLSAWVSEPVSIPQSRLSTDWEGSAWPRMPKWQITSGHHLNFQWKVLFWIQSMSFCSRYYSDYA